MNYLKEYHPYLFTIFMILFLYYTNIKELSFREIIVPLFFSLIATSILFFIAKKKFKKSPQIGLYLTSFIVLFFSYGRVADILDNPPHVAPIVWQTIELLIAGLLFFGIFFYLSKRKNSIKTKLMVVSFLALILSLAFYFILTNANFRSIFLYLHPLHLVQFFNANLYFFALLYFFIPLLALIFIIKRINSPQRVNEWLNTLSIILVIFIIAQILFYNFANTSRPSLADNPFSVQFEKDKVPQATLPDIYYIILDGYAGEGALKEHAGFDNLPFLNALKKRGFYVANESAANYMVTFLSLSSSLNMNYLDIYTDLIGANSRDRTLPFSVMDRPLVAQHLKSAGYRFIQFSSSIGATDKNDYADEFYDPFKLSEVGFLFIRSTPLRLLTPNEIPVVVLHNFEMLQKIAAREDKTPRFVFSHVYSPHPPYLFDRNGKIISEEYYDPSAEQWADLKGYVEQLKFINKKTLQSVDAILKKSKRPVLIIIQGDHGFITDPQWTKHPTQKNVDGRASILNAYYFYDQNYSQLYPSISPVNSFRVIFNEYLNQTLPLFPDQVYFSDDRDTPYQFVKAFEDQTYVGPFPRE
ncbi:hypothetical protein J4421_01465 [Candidatus Woesearchaeota archaeon]|nr:hypothetical protein [Candidatus Woesearchaeota archaeon]